MGADAFDMRVWRITMDQQAQGNLLHSGSLHGLSPRWKHCFQGRIWDSGFGSEIPTGRAEMLNKVVGGAENKGLEMGVSQTFRRI